MGATVDPSDDAELDPTEAAVGTQGSGADPAAPGPVRSEGRATAFRQNFKLLGHRGGRDGPIAHHPSLHHQGDEAAVDAWELRSRPIRIVEVVELVDIAASHLGEGAAACRGGSAHAAAVVVAEGTCGVGDRSQGVLAFALIHGSGGQVAELAIPQVFGGVGGLAVVGPGPGAIVPDARALQGVPRRRGPAVHRCAGNQHLAIFRLVEGGHDVGHARFGGIKGLTPGPTLACSLQT